MKNLDSNLILHFKKPHNIGEISCPDAVGKSDNAECPDNIIFTARINKNIIRDIKFKSSGCSYTIAAANCLAALAKNKDILKSTLITEKELEKYLGKFPEEKKPTLDAAINTLQDLVSDYISKSHTKNIYKKKSKKVSNMEYKYH